MAEDENDTAGDQSFLSRWSKRKQRAGRDAPDDPQNAVSGASETEPGQVAEEELAANRAAAEAINIDELDENSDYSPFFKAGVPSALKSAALRRLWRSNPVFANIDGLNDYDDDFTIPKTPLGAIKTAWKFGRGFLTDDDLAEKSGATSEPQTAETGVQTTQKKSGADDAPAAGTAKGEPVSSDPDAEPQGSPESDAFGQERKPESTHGVGLRDRLDMAAFSDRDKD